MSINDNMATTLGGASLKLNYAELILACAHLATKFAITLQFLEM